MKVLVVEDIKKIADNIARGLIREKMTVDVAYDGEDGLNMALSEKYDVVVLDVMLPKVDGFEICRQMRRKGVEFPVLMLTARGEVEDKVMGFEAGADDYLAKPFAFSEFVARIKALGRRVKQINGEKISVGELSLDIKTGQVMRRNKKIELSRKEFLLLEFLMRNKGSFFTAEELVEKVWSFDADVTINAAQVYISYLRKKIDRGLVKSLIKTKRGFGYKLDEG